MNNPATFELNEERVHTTFGQVKVSIYGEASSQKHPIVTFHDIGMDSEATFQNFFRFESAATFLKKFTIYNINAPGQESDAQPFPENHTYPSLDELVHLVGYIVNHYGFKSFIGLGVGAGANILLRYALKQPERVDALILVNANIGRSGWIEWGYEKIHLHSLQKSEMNKATVEYLTWHNLGKHLDDYKPSLVQEYRNYFQNHPNPRNLAAFIEAYLDRTEVVLHDPNAPSPYLLGNIPVLQLVGAESSFVDDVVHVNTKLNPEHSDWIKVADSCALVLVEKPEPVTEAIMLFLQGAGYLSTVDVHKVMRKLSLERSGSPEPPPYK
ncbi:ndr family domain-containing protein [Ditylenchus destructor]|nr:ndr family domain-containing protein [Ditylenchus destructor]